jgi:ParB-like chromosome segregation protein Spo0J
MFAANERKILSLSRLLELHPVAALFPELPAEDFAALKEDIRRNGLKVPVLVHGGEILDGRHRYKACKELGIPCRGVEWNGSNPWLEVQSRNLIRRHLAKDQVYAIRMLAALQFPELAGTIEAEREKARARRAQARGRPRGEKALPRFQDRIRESADRIGAQLGVSGSTVKRVERLAREAPALIEKVAAGELSVKRALRDLAAKTDVNGNGTGSHSVPLKITDELRTRDERKNGSAPAKGTLTLDRLLRCVELTIRAEAGKWPREERPKLVDELQQELVDLVRAFSINVQRSRDTPVRSARVKAHLRA